MAAAAVAVPDAGVGLGPQAAALRQAAGVAGTGHQSWHGASILGALLRSGGLGPGLELPMPEAPELEVPEAPGRRRRRPAAARRHVLELGAGCGALAMELAQGGFASVVTATDGEPSVVRNMKYNVQANKLGHAVRCRSWDWGQEPPKDLDLSAVDLCIGSDLVYYSRPHADLAAVLGRVLKAPRAEGRAPVRVLLLLTIRAAEDLGGGRVVHRVSAEGYPGSSVERFVEEELPEQLLRAERLQIPAEVFHNCLDPRSRAEFENEDAREASAFYEVFLR